MKSQGIAAHDKVFNFVFVQQHEQISEVWLYFHDIGASMLQPQQSVPLANALTRKQGRYQSKNH